MAGVRSNIKIKSNVYIRSPESLSDGDHPEKDAAFAAQVFAAASLNALKKRAEENGVSIAFSDIQQRILNGEQNIRLSELASTTSAKPAEQEIEEKASEGAPTSGTSEPADSVKVETAVEEMPPETVERAKDGAETAEIPSIQAVEHADQAKEDIETAEIPSIRAVEHTEQIKEEPAKTEIPSIQADEQGSVDLNRLIKRGFGGDRTLIVCADGGYAGYVSFMLHKNNVSHVLMNEFTASAPVRHFADVLWDCNDKVINRENFKRRFTARCPVDAARADECFDALCGFAGSAPTDGLVIGALAEKIMRGDVPDSLYSGGNSLITVAAADDADPKNFDKVYVLENGYDDPGFIAEDMGAARCNISGCPEIACGAGDGAAIIVDGAGKAAIGVGCGDVDRFSFIEGTVGDAVRKQAYISQNVKCGDGVRLELNGSVYDVIHNGMVIAKTSAALSERVVGEFGGTRYFEQLPQSLGNDLIVTNITAVVSCPGADKFGESVPPQFRDRNFWLGVEIRGYASEIGN